jgi:hypothetical protein
MRNTGLQVGIILIVSVEQNQGVGTCDEMLQTDPFLPMPRK